MWGQLHAVPALGSHIVAGLHDMITLVGTWRSTPLTVAEWWRAG